MKGVTFDIRDDLWDAGFQHKGIKYRKKFKTKEKAEEWLVNKKKEVKKNVIPSITKLLVEGCSPLAALWNDNSSEQLYNSFDK